MSAIVDFRHRLIAAEAVADRARAGGASLGDLPRWIAAGLVTAGKGLVARRRRRQTLFELRRLDDRTLRDIGVSPVDLPKCAAAGDLRGIADLLAPPPAGERSAREVRISNWIRRFR